MANHSHVSPPHRTPSLRATAQHSPSGHSVRVLEDTLKQRRPPRHKIRNFSRVLADMPFLDSLTGRKSVDSSPTASSLPRKSHSHNLWLGGPAEKLPSLQRLEPTQQLDLSRSRSAASAESWMVSTPPSLPSRSNTLSDLSVDLEVGLPPSTPTITSPSTLGSSHRLRNLWSPEDICLPPSRPSSSRGASKMLKRGRRQSLDILQSDEFGVKTIKLPRSRSLRFNSSSLSEISRTLAPRPSLKFHRPFNPAIVNNDSNQTDGPPPSAEQRYREIKRARKMTKLFGDEFPPELLRLKEDRQHTEVMRHRNESNASSIYDSTPSAPAFDQDDSPVTPSDDVYVQQSDMIRTSSRLKRQPSRPGFQERRKRIAKLTQFFGVNHSEIASEVAMSAQRGDHSQNVDEGFASARRHGYDSRVASLEQERPHAHLPMSCMNTAEVGVKIVSGRLWGMSEEKQDVDMSDVISKLRGLKAN